MNKSHLAILVFTALAIVAFAGNSVLTRLALTNDLISAADFTCIRLASGALMLGVLCRRNLRAVLPTRHDIMGVITLFIYAIAFTIAYLEINAATGALVLFAVVQLTMLSVSRLKGVKLSWLEYAGVAVAFGGLVYLLLPSAAAPPLSAAILMAFAGIAWGFYTLDGRGAGAPLQKTARNFIGAAMLGFIPLLFLSSAPLSAEGAALAVASGAITSALGYAVWYRVLPQLSVAMAGTSQLAVPMVAALGGALLINEAVSFELMIGSIIVLLGIGLTVFGKAKKRALL
jgi:drug/metabolite transporter (DMT)-like permease